MLNEVTISRGIINAYSKKLSDALELDVAIVGGGPSGLVAGTYLAMAGKKVALFDRRLSIGGGVWGGGMMFNEVVVQAEGKTVLMNWVSNANRMNPAITHWTPSTWPRGWCTRPLAPV